MLFPKTNAYRQFIDLSGYWDFCVDPKAVGVSEGWGEGLEGTRPIAVPASWNDQFEDWRDYLGDGWYQTRFDLPWGWEQQRVFVRFGSVNYLAEVWLNGHRLGEHEGGHLPFEFDITVPFQAPSGAKDVPAVSQARRRSLRVAGRIAGVGASPWLKYTW